MKLANCSRSVLLAAIFLFAAASSSQFLLFAAKKNDGVKSEARVKPDGLVAQGDTFAAQRNFAEASKLYDQAIKADSNNPYAYVHRAQASMKAQRLRSALADCEQAIKLK